MNENKRLWIGLGILGIAVVLIGGLVFTKYQKNNSLSYNNHTMTFSQVENAWKTLPDGGTALVVFHKSGCKKCESVEKQVMSQVNDAQTSSSPVVVTDTNKMSRADIDQLRSQFPSMVFNEEVRVPVALVVKKVGNQLVAVRQADLTDRDARNNAFGMVVNS